MSEKLIKKQSSKDLASKLQAMYRAKKKDATKVATGADIRIPDKYVKAPAPIAKLLSLPGYPYGRVVQVSGKPNSGKTTLAMLAMIEAQKDGAHVVMADTEGKFSKERFIKMGGNPEDILNCRATTLEEAFSFISDTLDIIYSDEPNAKVLVVFDSMGGTPSNAESESELDETIQLATAAKVIKKCFRVLIPMWIDKKDICMFVVNTNYANIGSVGRSNSGGDGLEYGSTIIMQLGRTGNLIKTVKGEKVIYGIKTKANVTKNHLIQGEHTLKEMDFNVTAYAVEDATSKKDEEE